MSMSNYFQIFRTRVELLVFFVLLSVFSACTKDTVPEVNLPQIHGPVTLKLDHITATTASFVGSVDLTMMLLYPEIGVIYSTDSSLSENNGIRVSINSLINNNFSETISDLPYGTQIYYAPYYLTVAGVLVIGSVSSFQTKDLIIDVSVDEFSIDGSSLKATCSVVGLDEIDKNINFGLCYSLMQWEGQNRYGDYVGFYGVSSESKSEIILYDLNIGVTYYYCYYTEQNGVLRYGKPQKFTISDPYKSAQKDLNVMSAVDLSSMGTANCYIVSKPGVYKFRSAESGQDHALKDVEFCTILWETFGTDLTPSVCDLISGVCYKDGYIMFQTSDVFREGNAVIAAKDIYGTILWSWHIWFTDQPLSQIYNFDSGSMMDRNLGATSATSGDVGTLGLLYQWGRKDPFLSVSAINSSSTAKSTLKWPSPVLSDPNTGTLEFAITHPTTFISTDRNSNYNDWYWYGNHDTRWTTSDRAKSKYDPCPLGWRVPDAELWWKAIWGDDYKDYYSYKGMYDSIKGGIDLSGVLGTTSSIWYPGFGDCYSYWSSSATLFPTSECLVLDDEGFLNIREGFRYSPMFVRCAKE